MDIGSTNRVFVTAWMVTEDGRESCSLTLYGDKLTPEAVVAKVKRSYRQDRGVVIRQNRRRRHTKGRA